MKKNSSQNHSKSTSIYELDGRPPFGQMFPLGLQQLLAMFVGNIVPMLLVSGGQDFLQKMRHCYCNVHYWAPALPH